MSFSATMTVRVEWGDCDPAGIVFYPNYFRWIDAAAWNLFKVRAVGLEGSSQRFGAVRIPLLGAECQFKSPSRFSDELLIESRVVSWERKVFRVAHRILNDGTVAVDGMETRCWTLPDPADPSRMQGVPIPDEVVQLFAAEDP